jgi:diguanylate cyclase (GGDEF)-like protein
MKAPSDLRDWLARLQHAIRAEEFYAVERDRRFLAKERRRMRGSARAAMLVIIGAVGLDVVAFSAIHAEEAPLIVSLNMAIGVLALAGFLILGGIGRRRPDVVVFVVSLSIVLASVLLGILGTGLAILAGGYVLILPAIVTLVVPLRPWAHTVWLLAYAVAAYSLLILAPGAAFADAERGDLAVLFLVAMVASFVGSVLRFRARATGHMQRMAMLVLRREAEAHRRALTLAQADLERVVRLDQLTQVGNRLRLVEDLAIARSRLQRIGEPFGLLEIDLDHFKAINDRFGHLVGDTVLHDVAAIFDRVSRAGDSVYRFGGEEFMVLLAGADQAATAAAGERLRRAVLDAAIQNPGNRPTGLVTVSVGGAAIVAADVVQTDQAWLERADRALYRAKSHGRNRVVMETIASEFGAA